MSDLLARLAERFADLEDELNTLDAAAGDGDHGTTMLRGLTAAAASDDPVKAFRTASGGASGSLFSHVLTAALSIADGAPAGDALGSAARRIAAVGQAKPGDRTMLDALLPAAAATDIETAARDAATGAEATAAMSARRGRARYVENAGLGHVDAGARSVAEILAVLTALEKELPR